MKFSALGEKSLVSQLGANTSFSFASPDECNEFCAPSVSKYPASLFLVSHFFQDEAKHARFIHAIFVRSFFPVFRRRRCITALEYPRNRKSQFIRLKGEKRVFFARKRILASFRPISRNRATIFAAEGKM